MADTIESLKGIWENQIRNDHEAGMFINEHTLQAALYHHIRTIEQIQGLRVVVEVTSFMMRKVNGIPDMVVLRDDDGKKTVEAVIELKCDANAFRYQEDIEKLATWAAMVDSGECCKDVFEANPRTLCWADCGVENYDSYYEFSADTHWIFAALGPSGCDAFDAERLQKIIRTVHQRAANANLWLFSGIIDGQSPGFGALRL
ncbi:MAG: hypothetical protein ISS69_18300 [Phycisphaerae bacterium]|nr:hypothetical protein [Phycisphaerae bacterium]